MLQNRDKIAILGAGTMGPGIATVYATNGYKCTIYSRTEKTLARSKEVIESNMRLLTEENMLSDEEAKSALSRLEYTTELQTAVDGAWYVVETIVEKPEAKEILYNQLDAILPEDVIIASNTSYMDIFTLMPKRRLPYSVISHWYAPAHILPLVEVVRGPETLDCVMNATYQLHKDCGKAPVRMEKFIPGFIVNRMQGAMTREVVYLIENGYCTPEDLDLAVKTSLMPRGLLLGLVQRMDFNGLDMAANGLNNKNYVPAPDPNRPKMIFDHYDKGEYGVKTGTGFYDYTHQSYTETLRQRDRMLLQSVRLGQAFIEEPLHNK